MHNYFYSYFILFCLVVSACGKGYEEKVVRNEIVADGHYHAKLLPINKRISTAYGFSTISIRDNQFWARVKVFGPKINSSHQQHIHLRDRCPTITDDKNGDGMIDAKEVFDVSGPVLIPLDSDLSSQIKGLNEFPKMRRHNFYYYSEATHSDRIMRDLRGPDHLRYDFMSKLAPGDPLALDSRVIIIFGTSENRPLPTSAVSYGGYPLHETIPVACGKIRAGELPELN